MFSFDEKKVNTKQEIGRGQFGSVYAYQKDPNDQRYVVKIMPTKRIDEFITSHIQEIVLGFSLDHPHVLPIKGFYINYDSYAEIWHTYLKIPRMSCSLKTKIDMQKEQHFIEDQIVKYFYELACGLQYLHGRGIAHRDIKSANILVDNNGELKIGDIGIGRFIQDETNTTLKEFNGTAAYCAPEIKAGNPLLKKRDLYRADIWSLGMVMAELCLLKLQPLDMSMLEQSETELSNRLSGLEGAHYSKILLDLISSLLKFDPLKRRTLQEVQKTLKENYPFLCSKVENQTEKEFSVTKLNKKETDRALKELQKKLKDDFKIQFDFPKSLIIEKQHDDITDSHLRNLMEELTQIQNLTGNRDIESFEINIWNCEKITDNGVKQLAQQLGTNFKSINQLTINFQAWKNDNITDEGIVELARQITKNLTSIRQLKLDFGGCRAITDNSFNLLVQQIRSNISNIHRLALFFEKTKVSQEAKEQSKNIFQDVPNIKIC